MCVEFLVASPASMWVPAEQIAIEQDQHVGIWKWISSHKEYNTEAKKLLCNKSFFVPWCPAPTVQALPSLWMAVRKQWHLFLFLYLKENGSELIQWEGTPVFDSVWLLLNHVSDWILTEHLVDRQAQDFSIQGRAQALSEIICLNPLGHWQVTERTSIRKEQQMTSSSLTSSRKLPFLFIGFAISLAQS